MIVRRFLLWARTASTGHRAEAIAALGRAYLHSNLSEDDRWEAETALTAMLDDRSPVVRRAMAESLASSEDAPRHVIVALASDQPDIATLVLERSPVLLECDLVDLAALGGARAQTSIARRPWVPAGVAAALCEIADPEALLELARNEGAEIGEAAFARLVERHGTDARLREALLARPDLPVHLAQALAAALARVLGDFVVGCGWLSPERAERVIRDARERTTVALSSGSEAGDLERLVGHLRRTGQLTSALILRALLSRDTRFAGAAFAELANLPEARVAAAFRDRGGHGFRALYDRVGLPRTLRPAFEGALAALRQTGGGAGAEIRLSRLVIRESLAACRSLPPAESGRLIALLRRFEAEAAMDEARRIADEMADEAALSAVLRHAPEALAAYDEEYRRWAA